VRRRLNGSVKWLVCIALAVTSGGCAMGPEHLPDMRTSLPLPGSDVNGGPALAIAQHPDVDENGAGPRMITVATESSTDLVAAAQAESRPPGSRDPAKGQGQEPAKKGDRVPDEDYDPFAKKGESVAEQEDYDPWESFNSRTFEFNRKFDKYVLKPVATGYEWVMPDPLERGITNFFQNVRFVPRLMNNLFQAKFKGAGVELGRFLINTTLGIGGLFDPAKHLLGMDTPGEDFGQTLGAYGVNPGPYLILPLLPPLTLRDAAGFLFVDLALDPLNYLVFPVMPYRFAGQPMLTVRDTATIAWWSQRTSQVVNDRAINLERFQGVEEATVDLYGAVRNAYLQSRARAVRE
jgi:phospholipid-binding lipoprotein MlaA